MRKSHDWESEFAALGLRGDSLQIALIRKKRSIFVEQESKSAQKNETYRLSYKGNEKEKKGWGSSTGTIVL